MLAARAIADEDRQRRQQGGEADPLCESRDHEAASTRRLASDWW